MPFNVGSAAAFIRRVVLKFNNEKLEVRYNAGEKFKAYQQLSQKLEREFADLQREIELESTNNEAYERLQKRLSTTRRALADNICTVIEDWDLEGDRDYIRGLMPEKEKKANAHVTGHGEIPIDGAWLDALPLPDEFIMRIVQTIGEDFSTGGAGTKKG